MEESTVDCTTAGFTGIIEHKLFLYPALQYLNMGSVSGNCFQAILITRVEDGQDAGSAELEVDMEECLYKIETKKI